MVPGGAPDLRRGMMAFSSTDLSRLDIRMSNLLAPERRCNAGYQFQIGLALRKLLQAKPAGIKVAIAEILLP